MQDTKKRAECIHIVTNGRKAVNVHTFTKYMDKKHFYHTSKIKFYDPKFQLESKHVSQHHVFVTLFEKKNSSFFSLLFDLRLFFLQDCFFQIQFAVFSVQVNSKHMNV